MIYRERMTAVVEDDFVVFLIGMRINKPWKVHKWLPLVRAMPAMLKELYQNPELGLLGHEQWFGRTTMMVQYWKSFDHLESYARDKNSTHLPAWSAFNKNIGQNGDIGIWHETYLSGRGRYECIYTNMPRFGLARLGDHVEASGQHQSARQRVGS